jgi:hypothetical protein
MCTTRITSMRTDPMILSVSLIRTAISTRGCGIGIHTFPTCTTPTGIESWRAELIFVNRLDVAWFLSHKCVSEGFDAAV